MKRCLLFVFICLLCFSLSAKVTIFLSLDKISKEPRMKPDTKCEDGQSYSDEILAISWEPLADGFRFTLTNKTKSALTIPWEECTFVLEDGATFHVAHATSGKVLTIDPESEVRGIVAPVDFLIWGKKGWSITPIFQEKWSEEEFQAIQNKELLYKVSVAIKKERIKTIYHFVFKAFAK